MIDADRIRADFPILNRTVHGKPLVYLDNAATSQKPTAVLEKVHDFYCTSNSNVQRGARYRSERESAAYEDARATVQAFLGAANAREIVFTRGTTDSVNVVARALETKVHAGDEIVVTEMEHHSNLIPWQMLCERNDAVLKVVPFDDRGELQVEVLESLLTERTRLVAVSYVSNVLGTVNPVRQVATVAHGHHIPVLVDAAQAVPRFGVDVADIDCDFLAFSGHKMYAETGIGVLYGKEKWLEELPPVQFGGGMISSVSLQRTTFAEPPFKFESGTPNIGGAVSLAAAVEYMRACGINQIHDHERELLDYAAKAVSEMGGTTVYGRAAERIGALSFNLEGISAYDAAMILDKTGVAVRSGMHCAQPVMDHYGITGTIRASFAVYNTKSDIDALLSGLTRVRNLLQ